MGSFHPKIWKDDHQGRVDVSNLNDYSDSNNQEPLSTIVRTAWYFLYVKSTNLWKEKHVMENGCPTGGGILSQKCGALAEKTNVSTIAEGFPLN